MLRFIRQLFKKKAKVFGPYKGYIGSLEHNGKSGLYQGKVLNIPHFWNERIPDLASLLDYSAVNKQMLERRFKDKVDFLADVIDGYWEGQKNKLK